jgi:hypothetical protein
MAEHIQVPQMRVQSLDEAELHDQDPPPLEEMR